MEQRALHILPSFAGVMAQWVLFGHIQEKLRLELQTCKDMCTCFTAAVLSLFEVSNVPRVEH